MQRTAPRSQSNLDKLQQIKAEMQQHKNLISVEHSFGLPTFAFTYLTGFFSSVSPFILLFTVAPSCVHAHIYNEHTEKLNKYFSDQRYTKTINHFLYGKLNTYTDRATHFLRDISRHITSIGSEDPTERFSNHLTNFTGILRDEGLLLKAYHYACKSKTEQIVKLAQHNDAIGGFLQSHHYPLQQLAKAFVSQVHTKQNEIMSDTTHYPELELYCDLFKLMELNNSPSFKYPRYLGQLPQRIPHLSTFNLQERMRGTFFDNMMQSVRQQVDSFMNPPQESPQSPR